MISPNPPLLTVTELNRLVKRFLEENLSPIVVQGEVSNLSRPASGHAYFSLKDASAQLRCVFFKNRHRKNTDEMLQNGQKLNLTGTLSLYEARGDYQLIVESIEAQGQGTLFQQFEALKAKLKAEGLFDAIHKKPIPEYPNTIGLITSTTGAAIRDMQTTLKRRFPLTTVRIYPSEVQGQNAAPQLIEAIKAAHHEALCDVLLLARGGGSIEDLWAFNDEALARTIFNSTLPIISGVGHETDFTIADFVADYRAATPTAAAETATPDKAALTAHFQRLNLRLETAITRLLQYQKEHLHHLTKRLKSPQTLLERHAQTLDYLSKQLHTQVTHILKQKEQALRQLSANLNTLSPLATLGRGYAIASTPKHIIRTTQDAPIGSQIKLQLLKDKLTCEVLSHD